jgi:hypothetical protein
MVRLPKNARDKKSKIFDEQIVDEKIEKFGFQDWNNIKFFMECLNIKKPQLLKGSKQQLTNEIEIAGQIKNEIAFVFEGILKSYSVKVDDFKDQDKSLINQVFQMVISKLLEYFYFSYEDNISLRSNEIIDPIYGLTETEHELYFPLKVFDEIQLIKESGECYRLIISI